MEQLLVNLIPHGYFYKPTLTGTSPFQVGEVMPIGQFLEFECLLSITELVFRTVLIMIYKHI